MGIISRCNLLSGAAIAAVLAVPQATYAQGASTEPAPSALEEIVVTAQKRTENLQDVPIAITALQGEVLKDSGVVTQVSLPRMTPGLTLNLGAGFTVPYIRGIGTTFATLGLESSVATYFDDQYLSRPVTGFFSFNDIDRIEVLKGPQGTLYGRNAAAGAIRIITKEPTKDFDARASVTYGRFDRAAFEGVVNVPIAETLSARVSGSYDNRDSYIKSNDANGGLGKRKEFLVRGKLRWEPSDALTAGLTVDYGRIRDPEAVGFVLIDKAAPTSVGLARGAAPSPDFYTTVSDYGPGSSEPNNITRTFGAQFRVDLDLGPATISSVSGYRWTDLDERGDQDSTRAPYSAFLFKESSKAYSQELQVVSKPGGPIKWIAGLYYYYEKGENDYQSYGQTINEAFGLPSGPTVGSIAGNPDYVLLGRAKTSALAPYAEGTYSFSDQWSVTLGARYTREIKTMIDNQNLVRGLGPEFGVFSESDVAYKFHQFTPKATISFKPVDDVLLYVTYSRGFKSGGFALPNVTFVTKVRPEILDSYEFGYKTQFGSLRLNGSAFYYDFKDLQVQRPSISGLRLENAANARVYGSEIEAVFAASDKLDFGFGGNYLNAKYKDYFGTANVPAASTAGCTAAGGAVAPFPPACIGYANVAADFSGQGMVNAPRFTAYARVQYRATLSGGNGSLTANGLLSYSGKYYYNPEHSLAEPSKYLLSASLTWTSESEKLSVTLFGDNLLGEKYDIYKTILVNPGAYRIPGAPRTWGVKLGLAL
jgi:iron complex outermembrane receptor protein